MARLFLSPFLPLSLFCLALIHFAQPLTNLDAGRHVITVGASGDFLSESLTDPALMLHGGPPSGRKTLSTEGTREIPKPHTHRKLLSLKRELASLLPPAPSPQTKPELRLAFSDFWPGFNPENNFFTNSLRTAFDVRIADSRVDLLVFSKFGDTHLEIPSARRIFYTGENVRPNLDAADLSLSFDRLPEDEPRHVRLPLWFLYVDWFGIDPIPNIVDPGILFKKGRQFFPGQREGITLIASNPSGFRTEIWPALQSELGELALSLGGFMTSPGYQALPMEEKLWGIGRRKLHLAIENSVYPGYATEKILHAYAGNAVPVYYGDPTIARDFNPRSFLDLSGMGVEEAVRAVRDLVWDEGRMEAMLAESPLELAFDVGFFVGKICEVGMRAIGGERGSH